MIKNKFTLLWLSCLFIFLSQFSSNSLIAQDLHATYTQFMPLYINPAKTGKYYGSYRLGGMYRDQFGTFIKKAYRSPIGWVDVPFTFAFAKNHWTALGISYFRDWSGDLGLTNSGIITSGAYHIGLNKKMSKVVSIGFQYASITRSFGDAQNGRTTELIRTGNNKDASLINGFKGGYQDFNAGIMYSAVNAANHQYEVGFSMYHLNSPSIRYTGGQQENEVKQRINFHAKYYYPITNEVGIEPTVVYSGIGKASNTNIQMQVYFTPSKKEEENSNKKILRNGTISAGIGYRLQDAIQFMLGYQWKQWQAGLAYDYTVSTAASYNRAVGAIELGIIYTGIVEKKVKAKPKVFCPRF